MPIQPLWLTYLIEILLVLDSNSQKLILARFLISPFRPQISSNDYLSMIDRFAENGLQT